MTEKKPFYHALKIRTDLCYGCTHCLKTCPTEAIRIRNGKAILLENRCVDCGRCFRACPVCAIIIEQDDFAMLKSFPIRVALVPTVFSDQFSEEISTSAIHSEILELGFTHVYEIDNTVWILKEEQNKYLNQNPDTRPVISSYCPAIVRLIQVKFPALVEHLLLLKQPVDIAAMHYKKKFVDEGYLPEQIGLFYVTPCASKIAAVKSPVGEQKSVITGVINMNFLYNKVLTGIKQSDKSNCILPEPHAMSPTGILWSLTRGESVHMGGRSLAIDGIHNVIEFLDKLENLEDPDIDFLELRACDESCAGGVLTTGNRFLTVERMYKRSTHAKEKKLHEMFSYQDLNVNKEYLVNNMPLQKVLPRSMMKLDENMSEAMRKMKRVHELMLYLPQVDCGSCGSPSCASLAEDVVQDRANISQCIFVQRVLEERQVFTTAESKNRLENIWGIEKFNRKWQINP